MALTTYEGPGEVYVDGNLQAEVRTARVSVNSNDNPVITMRKGKAGFSDGPVEASATLDGAIPKAGYEQDFYQTLIDKTEIRLVLVSAGTRKQFAMRVLTYEESYSESGAAEYSATLDGRPDGVL